MLAPSHITDTWQDRIQQIFRAETLALPVVTGLYPELLRDRDVLRHVVH